MAANPITSTNHVSLDQLLKQLLESLRTSGLEDITSKDVEGLLSEDPSATAESKQENLKESGEGAGDSIGYPQSPLYIQLSQRLATWMSARSSDVLYLPEFEGFNEEPGASMRNEMFAAVNVDINDLQNYFEENDMKTSREILLLIIKKLRKRGLLSLLGLRNTEGSVDMFPPARSCLVSSFSQQNSSNSQLSVGARALSKHCHRDETASWWGCSTGSEAEKNNHADKVVNHILNEAAWINIHSLPHSVVTIEVRSAEGYGARWTADGSKFRGFLEPQMEDGHLVGWRH